MRRRGQAARTLHPASWGEAAAALAKPCFAVLTTCPLSLLLPCSYTSAELNKQSVQLAAGQCQLRFQEMVAVQAGWPPALLAKGPAGGGAAFTCGAPLVAWGPEVPGFQRSIGKGLYTWCAARVAIWWHHACCDGAGMQGRAPVQAVHAVSLPCLPTPRRGRYNCTESLRCAGVGWRATNRRCSWRPAGAARRATGGMPLPEPRCC